MTTAKFTIRLAPIFPVNARPKSAAIIAVRRVKKRAVQPIACADTPSAAPKPENFGGKNNAENQRRIRCRFDKAE